MSNNEEISNIIKNISEETQEDISFRDSAISLTIGFLIFIISIFILEKFNQPFYFTNDDNLHEFLFPIIYGCKTFFAKGVIAEINPFQYAGTPLASVGTYALTYPITYICYLIAKYIIHNEYCIMDVFCIFHLGLAYLLSYYAAKTCGVKGYLRVIFALCYSLSGYSLVAGRSWYNMTPCIAFAPIIVISVNYLIKNKMDLKWIFLTGMPLGLLGLTGQVQMWIYTLMFFYLSFLIMFLLKKINFEKLYNLIFPSILFIAICLPQIYVTMRLAEGIHRDYTKGWEYVKDNLITFLIPNYDLNTYQFGTAAGKIICFSGCIFIAVFLLSFALIIIRRPKILPTFFKNNPWLIIGIIAFCFAFTNDSIFWSTLRLIPLFKKFRESIRLLIFVNLFLNLGGAIILSKLESSSKKRFKVIIIALMSFVLINHLLYTKQAFFRYDTATILKNPSIAEKISDMKQHRIFSIGPFRSNYSKNRMLCNSNFATGYELYSTTGYDDNFGSILKQNIFKTNLPMPIYSLYGVKYIIFQKPMLNGNEADINFINQSIDYEKNLNKKLKKVYTDGLIDVYETPVSFPLAFIEKTRKALPIEFNSQGAIIKLPKFDKSEYIIVNMVYYPKYNAYIVNNSTKDKKKIFISQNIISQIRVKVPPQSKETTLLIEYQSNWLFGILMGISLIIIGSGLYLAKKQKTK